MKLDDVIKKVAASTGLARPDAKKAIEGAFAEIRSSVDAGEKVVVPGLGIFLTKERPAGEKLGKDGKVRQVEAARHLVLKARRKAAGAAAAGPKRKKKKAKEAAAAK
jgi:nucleoid DNA-binding protein